MELWIRSQDRLRLMKVEQIDISKDDKTKKYHLMYCFIKLATYNSKERALEVLNEIEERLALINTMSLANDRDSLISCKNAIGEEKIRGLAYPYQMPQE